MRAVGRESTPMASLSRSFGAVRGRTLILCLPGSPRGALGIARRGGAAAGAQPRDGGWPDRPRRVSELIPLYPLAAVVFLGAGALFALQMARHLRVFATARAVTVTDRAESRFDALIRYAIIQIRMFRDPASGMSHLVIFWGFVILSLGTLDRIFFGLVHDILAAPLDGWLWRLLLLTQNLLIVGVLGAVTFSIARRLLARPRRMTLSRDGIVILLLIGAVVATELLRGGVPDRGPRRPRRRLGLRGERALCSRSPPSPATTPPRSTPATRSSSG